MFLAVFFSCGVDKPGPNIHPQFRNEGDALNPLLDENRQFHPQFWGLCNRASMALQSLQALGSFIFLNDFEAKHATSLEPERVTFENFGEPRLQNFGNFPRFARTPSAKVLEIVQARSVFQNSRR